MICAVMPFMRPRLCSIHDERPVAIMSAGWPSVEELLAPIVLVRRRLWFRESCLFRYHSALTQIRLTVGCEDRDSTVKMNNNSQNGGAGGRSFVGISQLTAALQSLFKVWRITAEMGALAVELPGAA